MKMRNKKVLHVLHELKYSGAEIMYVDSADIYINSGYSVNVLATAKNIGEYANSFKDAGFDVFHKPYPKSGYFMNKIIYMFKFVKFLKLYNFDIVHIHSDDLMFITAISTRLLCIKSIFTFHNVFPTHWYSIAYHIFKRFFAKHVFRCKFHTISESVYRNELNIFKNETILINNWYNNNRYYPAKNDEKKKIRELLKIPLESIVIISIGGCSDTKRHTDIIKACEIIQNKKIDFYYLHLGKGANENDEIEMCKNLQIINKVRFVGNTKDVREYLIASDIYVMSSKNEGMPITTIEAMGSGIPCILYNVPGLRDFGANCILINESTLELAESIIKLYNDKNKINELSKRAKLYVDENYSMYINVQKILSLYNL